MSSRPTSKSSPKAATRNPLSRSGTACRRVLAVICLAAGLAAGLSANAADWPMWRYDAARSGSSPHELAETLHLQWTRELPPPRRAWPEQVDDHGKLGFDASYEPVAAEGMLFVPSMVTDSVTAYRLDTGEEVWRFFASGPVRLAPAYAGGRLYVGSDDGFLYCLDAATGNEVWRFQAAPTSRLVLGNERLISVWPVRGGPVVADGKVYFASGVWPFEGVFVHALDAESGEVQWTYSGVGDYTADSYSDGARSFSTISPQGYLAVDGDSLIVSGGRTTPGVFDRHTGQLLAFDRVDKRAGGYAVSAEASRYLLPVNRSEIRVGGQEHNCSDWSERIGRPVRRLLSAEGRLIAVAEDGSIHVFGAEPRPPTTYAYDPSPLDAAGGEWASRAEALLREANPHTGYAFMFGIGTGRLLDALASQSDVHVFAFDPDPQKVAALRERYVRAGLYGTRVSVFEGDAFSHELPPYVAGLVVSEAPEDAGGTLDGRLAEVLYHCARPYGGLVDLPLRGAAAEAFAQAARSADLEKAEIERNARGVAIRRPGPLPDSDLWTHHNANAANTAYSDDNRVKAPLGLVWYGGTDNSKTLPRHMFGPKPLVAEGVLVLLGVDHASARCVYTGREVWAVELPLVGAFFTSLAHEERFFPGQRVYFPSHHGANFVGSPIVATTESVYVLHEDRCLRLDLITGETLAEFELPDREAIHAMIPDGAAESYAARETREFDRRWGYVSVAGDDLVVGAYPHIYEERPDRPDLETPRGSGHIVPERGVRWHWNATSSEYVLAMNRKTGDIRWARQARYGFRHNAIASGAGRTYVLDHISEEVLGWLQRRGIAPEAKPEIRALDTRSGETLWTYDEEVFGTWLSYSERHDILVQSGRPGGRSRLPDEPSSAMLALCGTEGAVLWRESRGFRGPLALHETLGRIMPQNMDIRTGETAQRLNPFTGEPERWGFTANKRCGSQNTSRHLLTFRSSMASYHDLTIESGTINVSGVRSGCTDNMIVADGMLNMPDYTRTCSCAYQLQTSAGLAHMPGIELWSTHTFGRPEPGAIRKLGVNLGAPGDRLAEDGMLWVHRPQSAPGAALAVDVYDAAAERVPIRVVDTYASANPEGLHLALDGDSSTHWSARSVRRGDFRTRLQFDLATAVELDRLQIEWVAPAETDIDLRIQQADGRWRRVFRENVGAEGDDFHTEVWHFDRPRLVRGVQIRVGEYSAEEDSRGRIPRKHLRVAQIGLLPPEDDTAHGEYLPFTLFRRHPLEVNGGDSLDWVAAFGVRDVRQLTVNELNGNGGPYAVRLHFAEPDAIAEGQRVFHVRLQGETVAENVDVLRLAGEPRRGVALAFDGIRLEDSLRIELEPAEGTAYPPVLSGVELRRAE